MKIIFIVTFLISSALLFAQDKNSNVKSEWLGMLTIDNYPVKKCEIVKIGEVIAYTKYLTKLIGEKNEPLWDSAKLLAGVTNEELSSDLQKQAVDAGYNALFGLKFSSESIVLPVVDLKIVNGSRGIIFSNFSAFGTPVKIVCN